MGMRCCGRRASAAAAAAAALLVWHLATVLSFSHQDPSHLRPRPSGLGLGLAPASLGADVGGEGGVCRPPCAVKAGVPRLYIYDHCPFCVRARMIFGLKGIKHDLFFLANDDLETPTRLVGKKVVPILEIYPGGAQEVEVMKESMDIVRRIDEDPAYGPPILKPLSTREDITQWEQSCANVMRRLIRPRYMKVPLPEFAFRSARETFIKNHPLPDPSDYEANLAMSGQLVDEMNIYLHQLDPLIATSEYATVGGLSYDDISLWARLRSLSLVRGLVYPLKVEGYLKGLSERCDIPLYSTMAC